MVDYFLMTHDMIPQCASCNVNVLLNIVHESHFQTFLYTHSTVPDHVLLTCSLYIDVLSL